MKKNIVEDLSRLFYKTFSENISDCEKLPLSGSERIYYRLKSTNAQAIGTFNPNRRENDAFIYFSTFFKAKSLAVPEIYAHDLDNDIYLQEDLGNQSLYELMHNEKKSGEFSNQLKTAYKKALKALIDFQIKGADIDTSYCYPRSFFDEQSMQWDLNYFKYYFLKLANIPFDEQYIEDDFQKLIAYIQHIDSKYFMYRDFQSRNILMHKSQPYFIDYQGGRLGPLQYDLASLLFQVKADIPYNIREELLNYYIDNLPKKLQIDKEKFEKEYYAIVLIRLMQVMGAYGYRGFFERKSHWLSSIPFAQKNVKWLLEKKLPEIDLPHLFNALQMIANKNIAAIQPACKLKVEINSFSYKRGIPVELAGNGGGHVFDCRALPNPGRQAEFKSLTGKDKAVIDFLEASKEISDFRQHTFFIVEQSIKNYLERGFSNLMINFGCTGGQHRSVYFAQQLADYLRDKYDIEIELKHREQDKI